MTVVFLLVKQETTIKTSEVVATVGSEKITRQDWLKEMEARFGQDVLKELIDHKVIELMAEKYDIKVTDEAIDRELLLIKTMYGMSSTDSSNEEGWRKQIKSSLLLEEILTKDVVIPDEQLRDYYEQNKNMYSIPTTYHVSQIVVSTEEEALMALAELDDGSDFATLARERSIDEFSAGKGGDIGFIREDDERFPPAYFEALAKLKLSKWTKPIQTNDGYIISMLHEKVKGRTYSFKEVKDEIGRQIALEQMEGTSSASTFWDEVNVDWFYGESEAK